jgi:hypothetical protein
VSSKSSAVTDQQSDGLNASAAGTSSESGPGVPDDFTGVVTESLPVTKEELDAIAASNALRQLRQPHGKKATDVGFGRNRLGVQPSSATAGQ